MLLEVSNLDFAVTAVLLALALETIYKVGDTVSSVGKKQKLCQHTTMPPMKLPKVFDHTINILGEGPLWHPKLQTLFWFDILTNNAHVRWLKS